MKRRTLLLGLAAFAATFSTVSPAAGTRACPALLLLQLARQVTPQPQREYQGLPLPPERSRPPADPSRWGVDTAMSERASDAFLRHIGETNLLGLFLLGPRPGFVAFVRSGADAVDIEAIRAELAEDFGEVNVEVYRTAIACRDCPHRTGPLCGAGIDIPGCELPVDTESPVEAARLWPR